MNYRVLLAILFGASLFSCGKVEGDGSSIAFSVDACSPGMMAQTKAIAQADGSNLDQFDIKVYSSGPLTTNGLPLSRDNVSGYWYPNGNKSWGTWNTSGGEYTFFATAVPRSISNASITVNSPSNITIHQPDTYLPDSFIDYLLSYRFRTPGSAQPVVRLQLAHSMSLVQVIVVKDRSIDDVRVTSMSLDKFYNQGTGDCREHKQYSQDLTEPNVWNFSPDGNDDHTYTRESAFTANPKSGGLVVEDEDSDRRYTDGAMMSAMMLPQNVESSISLEYYVNESVDGVDNYVRHEEDRISLSGPGLPIRWESGHRYVYVIKIDTGIHIDAQILDWQHIDYIEGTVLPGI